jgi:hypothetical protein
MGLSHKRLILFIFGCFISRLLLALLAKKLPIKFLPYMGYIALIPAIGFLVIYFGNLRKMGIEVGYNDIWWDALRPIHGFAFLLFAIYAMEKKDYAWIVLLCDAFFGLVAFIAFHYVNNDFTDMT